MAVGQVSSTESQRRWIDKNKPHHVNNCKNRDIKNKEHDKTTRRKLKIKRELLEIDESLAKPWEDPDSLFCSPKLKEIIGKEPLKSDKCVSN